MADGSLVLDRLDARVRDRFTADEFMAMVEGRAFGDLAHMELADGRIIEMPPEGGGHAYNKMKAAKVLDAIAVRQTGLHVVADMAIDLGPGEVASADAMVHERFPPPRPRRAPAASIRLLVEHSDSTRRYDLNVKPGRYAAADIPELWVLDNVALLLHRFHTPSDGLYERDPPRGLDEFVDVPFAPGERLRVRDLFDLS